jgi:signal transduction histidine kinase
MISRTVSLPCFSEGAPVSDGSGLGLYTVKKAVEKLGGRYLVSSPVPFERTAVQTTTR